MAGVPMECKATASAGTLRRGALRCQTAPAGHVDKAVSLQRVILFRLNVLAGTVGGCAEIAWVIGHPWQGRGYAKRAAELLVAELVDCGVCRVAAHIHPDHVASQRIALHLEMVASDAVVDGETRWVGELG